MNKTAVTFYLLCGFALSGTAFAQAPLKTQMFPLPGEFQYGYEYKLAHDNYRLIDLTGDGKPDLLDAENEATNPEPDVFTNAEQPCWKVYTSTGTGLNPAATLWPIPRNFNSGKEHELTGNKFMLIDMNGDKKPDLLDMENENTPADDAFATGTQHYWKVYTNTGKGFSAEAIQWNIPPGFQYDFDYTSDHDNFTLMDMNGDGKPDLLDTENEATNPDEDTFTNGTQKAWKVYYNTGTGFTM